MKQKPIDKTSLLLFLGGCILILMLVRFVSNGTRSPASLNAPDAAKTQALSDHSDPDAERKKSRTTTKGDASRKVVIHQAADFAQGEQNNVIVKDGLRMGDDPTFVYEPEPGRVFGVYVSPEEETAESFDTFIVSYDATTPDSSILNCAFRVKTETGAWSDWREVTPQELNQPVRLGDIVLSWQYRLTFYANSAAASPQVRSVKVTTLRFGATQLSMQSSP